MATKFHTPEEVDVVTVVKSLPKPEFSYEFNGSTIVLEVNGESLSTTDLLAIAIDPQGLLEAFSNQSGLQAWIGMVTADAEADVDELKCELSIIEAECDQEIRAAAVEAQEKVSEALVDARIRLAEDYQRGQSNYLFAVRKYKMLRPFYDAIRTRGQLLPSIGGFIRDELKQPYNNKD